MKTITMAIAAISALSLGLAGCNKERKAEVDTGTAKAEVSTSAPPSVVPNEQLQQQAQQAATAASTPVDGSGPVATTSVAPTNAPMTK